MHNPDIATFQNEKTRQITTFNAEKRSKTVPVRRGQRATIAEASGSGTITSLWLTFPGWFWQHWNPPAPISQTILKTLILRIWFDGGARPAVEAPVGDFFGCGLCEITNFASQYFGMSSGGFFCKFPMPFRRGFRIEVENLDEAIDTDVFANVLYQEIDAPDEGVGYFHAQFRTARLNGPEPVDILDVSSRGHYVGCVLSTQGEDPNYLSFLEAPEHVWLDGGTEPAILGTGLEDYFLGGWYFREGTIAGPTHGVTAKDALNASVAMYRIHERDAIRFERSIRFQFVNPWAPERLKPFAYSSVAFCYLDSPEGQGGPLPGAKELLCWYRVKNTDHISIP